MGVTTREQGTGGTGGGRESKNHKSNRVNTGLYGKSRDRRKFINIGKETNMGQVDDIQS